MKKQNTQHSFNVLYLNLLLVFSATAGVVNATELPSTEQRTTAEASPCSHESRNTGAVIGGLGAAIAAKVFFGSDNAGAVAAGAVGAVLGGVIGNEMDLRKCELEQIAKKNNLTMEIADIKGEVSDKVETSSGKSQGSDNVGLAVSVLDKGEGQFLTASDKLQPAAETAFREMALKYLVSKDTVDKTLPQNATPEQRKETELALKNASESKRILLVGHTDDTGNSRYNANLSERRARAVAKVFQSVGIPQEHISYQGAGETLPLGDNHTEEGRAKNRRVEIVDVSDEYAFQKYLASRKPNVSYYRVVEQTAQADKDERHQINGPGEQFTQQVQLDNGEFSNQPQGATKPASHVNGPLLRSAKSGQNRVVSGKAATQQNMGPTPVKITDQVSIDFGGEPLVAKNQPKLDIGKVSSNAPTTLASVGNAFSNIFVSSAHASVDGVVASSCTKDRPRISNGVKSLRNDKEIHTTDEFMPGLYGTSWVGTVNNHLVALTNVAVLRDGAAPAGRPTMLVYRDYDPEQKRKADVMETPEVNAYRGDKALLYRVFPAGGTVRCMDIVIPNAAPTSATGSWIYQEKGGKIFTAAYSAKLAK